MRFVASIRSVIRRGFRSGAAEVFFGAVATKGVTLVGTILIARILSKSELSQLTLIENIFGYVLIFAGWGLAEASVRYLVLSRDSDHAFSLYKYFLFAGFARTSVVVLFAVVLLYFIPLPGFMHGAGWLVLVVLLVVPLEYVKNLATMTMRALSANRLFALCSFLVAVALVLGRSVGAAVSGVDGAVIGRFLIAFFVGVAMIVIVKRAFFARSSASATASTERRGVSKYGLQLMVTNGLWSVFMLNDIMLISIFDGSASGVAEFRVAYTLPANLSIISISAGIVVAPYFIRHETDPSWVGRKYFQLLAGLSACIVVVAALLALVAEPLLTLLFGSEYSGVANLMRILLIAQVFNCGFRYISAHLLSSMGMAVANLYVSFAGVIVQVALAWILIPAHGVYGAAVASCIVYGLLATAVVSIFCARFGRRAVSA